MWGSKADPQRNIRLSVLICLSFLFMMLWGCAGKTPAPTAETPPPPKPERLAESKPSPPQEETKPQTIFRPAVQWKPSFSVKDVKVQEKRAKLPELKTGAALNTSGGKVTLSEVMKGLADLKHMNLSWASDVRQDALVDVNISPDDDFWVAIDNILRQLDYFFEFKNNTIIVKYKDTKRFYLPMPFLTGSYKSTVGGDLLGNDETTAGLMKGTVSVEHTDEEIDIWANIKENLDRILQLATTEVPTQQTGLTAEDERRIQEFCRKQYPSRPAQQALCVERERAKLEMNPQGVQTGTTGQATGKSVASTRNYKGDREGFFYTIDKPLGIITVTAPRSLLGQVESYIDALKKELSRQVMIEAKIIEVQLSDGYQQGVDWSELLEHSSFSTTLTFGDAGRIYPKEGVKFISRVDVSAKTFNLFLSALNRYGTVRVLSNPKIALLNGHPAMITVGESVKYVDSVTSTIDSETGIRTYTVETKSLLDGLGLGVMANITSDDEVVLHLTPVVSKLNGEIEYEYFGGDQSRVGLPKIKLREMSTMARVKNGQLLIIGGLIDDLTTTDKSKVPLLGDVPVLGQAFRHASESTVKRELIILLRPQIVSL